MWMLDCEYWALSIEHWALSIHLWTTMVSCEWWMVKDEIYCMETRDSRLETGEKTKRKRREEQERESWSKPSKPGTSNQRVGVTISLQFPIQSKPPWIQTYLHTLPTPLFSLSSPQSWSWSWSGLDLLRCILFSCFLLMIYQYRIPSLKTQDSRLKARHSLKTPLKALHSTHYTLRSL